MKERIGDICTLKSGTTLKEDMLIEDGPIPYVKVSDMNLVGNEKYIVTANSYVSADINEKMLFPEGTVLFPKRGGAIGTNKKRIASKTICADLNTMGVIPSNKIRPLYLYYYFKNIDFGSLYNGSSVPQINNTDIAPMVIDLPAVADQDIALAKLEKIDHIIQKRTEELAKLDDLIKARFVELFGDPETNPMGWEQMTLNDVCSSVVRGPFGSALKKEFFVEPGENTYKVYEQKHAIQKSAEIGTYYISEEKYNELKRFECLPGDILMSCSGTMGELYQLPEGCAKGVINQALCKFTLNEKILPVCFLEYMRQTIGNLETKGSGIQNIAAVSYVKAMPINVPTMDVQRQFVSFVEQVDKSKVAVQESLDETQQLFDSLMQQYFG